MIALFAVAACVAPGGPAGGPRTGSSEGPSTGPSTGHAWAEPRLGSAAEELAPVLDSGISDDQVREHLEGIGSRVRGGAGVVQAGVVTYVATDGDPASDGRALGDAMDAAAGAMRAAGWGLGDRLPPLVVLRGSVPDGATRTVWATDRKAVFQCSPRHATGPRVGPVPVLTPRTDGPPTLRDVLLHTMRVRLWLVQRAAIGSPVSDGELVARRLVGEFVPESAAPPWLREGLVLHLARAAGAPAPGHVCRAWGAPTPAAVAKAVTSAELPAAAGAFFGRFVSALFDGTPAPADKFFALGKHPGPLATAVQETFGKSLDAVIAAASVKPPAAAGAPGAGAASAAGLSCDDNGVVPCVACAGAGKHELACTDCAGTGALCCPACNGSDLCPNCVRGWVYFEIGRKVKCRFCAGGKLKCNACGGSQRAPCKSCAGRSKVSRPCLVCEGGRMPCPEIGLSLRTTCRWCAETKAGAATSGAALRACDDCSGIGHLGCDECFGTLKQYCAECIGTGEIRMVYEDGTTASNSKCSACDGRGGTKCTDCKSGKLPCETCNGKGRVPAEPDDCEACSGDGSLPTPSPALARSLTRVTLGIESDVAKKMQDRAIAFLLTCRTSDGVFALRALRRGSNPQTPRLLKASSYSNADVLMTLLLAGRTADDPLLARAWKRLEEDARRVAGGDVSADSAQSVSIMLRALLAGRRGGSEDLVRALTDTLVKAQRPDGFWTTLFDDPPTEANAFDSLFVAEALRAARLRGVKVPNAVWQRLHRAATANLDARAFSTKNDYLTGTTVASAMALAIISKEGTLGKKATSFDYMSLPQVRKGLAWLDRHFDAIEEPQFSRGARIPKGDDRGFSAWIYSVQRLGMLLRIEELGGERWYTSALLRLAVLQFPGGEFDERAVSPLNGSVRTTTSVLLFLLRATPPITDVDDGE